MADDMPKEQEASRYSGREKEVYDLYVSEKGKPPTDDWVKLYAGKKYASDDFIRADLKGYIKYEFVPNDPERYAKEGADPATYEGKGHWRHIYSQKAADLMGGKIDVSHVAGGTEIIAPKDSLTGSNYRFLTDIPENAERTDLAGLQQFVHEGQPKTGIVGSILGDSAAKKLNDLLPDEVQAVADLYTLGTGNALAFGAEGAKDVNNAWRRAGLEEAKPYVDTAAKIAATVAATVATGGNPLAGAAVASGTTALQGAASREAGYDKSWRSIIKDSAVSGATAYAGGKLSEWARGVGEASMASQRAGEITAEQAARHAENARFLATVGHAGIGAAGAAATGGDVKAALVSSAASGIIGGDAATRAATAAGTSYLLSDGPASQRFTQAGFSAGQSLAFSGLSGRGADTPLFGGPLTRKPTGWRDTIRFSQAWKSQGVLGLSTEFPDLEINRETL